MKAVGQECRIVSAHFSRAHIRRSESALALSSAHPENRFYPVRFSNTFCGLAPNSLKASQAQVLFANPLNTRIDFRKESYFLMESKAPSLFMEKDYLYRFNPSSERCFYSMFFQRLEYIACLFFEVFQLDKLKAGPPLKLHCDDPSEPKEDSSDKAAEEEQIVRSEKPRASPERQLVQIVQTLAKSTICNLLRTRQISLLESQMCIRVLHQISEDELIPFISDLNNTAFIVSMIFNQRLYNVLPLFFPSMYKFISGTSTEFDSKSCLSMGVPASELKLTRALEIITCETAKERQVKIRSSVNSLRFAMQKLKIRACLPWLFKGQIPDYFYRENIFQVLGAYGFTPITEKEARPNDLVAHLNGGKVVHYSVCVSDGGKVVQSKLERTIPMQHNLYALPTKLINNEPKVIFFRNEAHLIELQLQEIVKSKTTKLKDIEHLEPELKKICREVQVFLEIQTYCSLTENSSKLYSSAYYSTLTARLDTEMMGLINFSKTGTFAQVMEKISILNDELKSGRFFNADFLTPRHREKVAKLFAPQEIEKV